MNKNKKGKCCCIVSGLYYDNNINKFSIKENIAKKIDEIYNQGINIFYCNGSYGVSMIAAETILSLKKNIKNKIIYSEITSEI